MKKLVAAAALASLLAGCGAAVRAPMAPMAPAGVAQAMAKKKLHPDFAKAGKWVAANSAGSFWDDPRKALFPATDDGNSGTSARAFADADGAFVAAFTKAWFQSFKRPPQFDFDPKAHLMVIVETSDDEPVLIVALFDRATGKGRVLGEVGIVDTGYNLTQEAFAKLFPTLGNVQDVDWEQVLKQINKRGAAI